MDVPTPTIRKDSVDSVAVPWPPCSNILPLGLITAGSLYLSLSLYNPHRTGLSFDFVGSHTNGDWYLVGSNKKVASLVLAALRKIASWSTQYTDIALIHLEPMMQGKRCCESAVAMTSIVDNFA